MLLDGLNRRKDSAEELWKIDVRDWLSADTPKGTPAESENPGSVYNLLTGYPGSLQASA